MRSLVFLGFPLHPSGKPSIERAAHLADVHLPMLFIQGTRDGLADASLMIGVVDRLRPAATLVEVDGADHGFRVPKRSGRTNDEVLATMLDAVATWINRRQQPD